VAQGVNGAAKTDRRLIWGEVHAEAVPVIAADTIHSDEARFAPLVKADEHNVAVATLRELSFLNQQIHNVTGEWVFQSFPSVECFGRWLRLDTLSEKAYFLLS
jgi:hypothetical protein